MSPTFDPIVIIPARLEARRLPGKPLAEMAGEAMIVHVWRRAQEAEVGPVVVACGETEIAEVVEAAGGRAVLTRPDHPSGSDRVWEALRAVDPDGRHQAVVNLQGDLPLIEPAAIRAVLEPLTEPAVDIATLVAEIVDDDERSDPNVVKAALALESGARSGRALYFSRATVPAGEGPHYHHIGIYAYRREALERFVGLPPAALEKRERLEQLRALEAGMRIDGALVDTVPFGVDTPADLERARQLLARRGG
ncbi:MAG: 3-deoxy-manno-octulosonate cytidylyltransferase [Alphaproteobacteria bacterium]|jgi:3-deoxy-manno-octulosonate cytidylyltransferase (CMP-KDO synthetase)|nr:3-deoxy-manno-octulosonate cytidylyltransferase [Rhodospirillaceae bacterium]MDP6404029.1 3-deoxy-manno-octulosonate cytidylyltransferase [Alphaproteobacteria bacterium]MDP6620859.1 3-deoxy-manno-octulosonate cytidylyltransferase [Alphaproteobacteria bacterium]|tara:strand:+ start:15 stop:767 length:753 start_codon:yes stop_codon:yes gene_type:complete